MQIAVFTLLTLFQVHAEVLLNYPPLFTCMIWTNYFQQARVIEESIDFKVGCYTGGTKRLRTHEEWQKEIDQHEVIVWLFICELHRHITILDHKVD